MTTTTRVPEAASAQVSAGPEMPAAAQMHMILHRRIITGDILPGTRLSEQEIASQYDLSRQPVREAFIRLVGEGLLEVRPQRGTFVSRIDMDWVLSTRFIREAVEADIVRLAALNAQPAQIQKLREILVRQDAIPQGDAAALVTLDEEFHCTLAEMADKVMAWNHLQVLKVHLDRVRHLVSAVTPKDIMLDQHSEVVEAVASGDPDRAESAMRLHLRRVFGDLPGIMQLSPQYFDSAEKLSCMHYDLAVNT